MRILGPLVCSTTLAEVFAVDQQHGHERDLVAGGAVDLLDGDHVVDGHLVLLAAGLDDRVHGRTAPKLGGRGEVPSWVAWSSRPRAAARSAAQASRVRNGF